jgi:hypothetical protein
MKLFRSPEEEEDRARCLLTRRKFLFLGAAAAGAAIIKVPAIIEACPFSLRGQNVKPLEPNFDVYRMSQWADYLQESDVRLTVHHYTLEDIERLRYLYAR